MITGGGGMYDDIIHSAMDPQLLTEIRERDSNHKRLPIWSKLHEIHPTQDFEQKLSDEGKLKFDAIFNEPIGYYLMKTFLESEYSVDKAVFLNEVKMYKQLQHPKARGTAAHKIYQTFCVPDEENDNLQRFCVPDEKVMCKDSKNKKPPEEQQLLMNDNFSLFTEKTNCIGVYGAPIKRLQQKLNNTQYDDNIFDEIAKEVYNDLRFDVFPRFCQSHLYIMYLRCKTMEQRQYDVSDFHQMRKLGRGSLGFVNVCKKKDTGALYAMKQLNLRRIDTTNSKEIVMDEKNILSDLDSKFVTSLKYSFKDSETLYLIMDLALGGNLKYHLNYDGSFNVERTKFYAAEILLGLEHLHKKGIVYRDLKFENVLVADDGHCMLSNFGLAGKLKKDTADKPSKNTGLLRGYAGTPGYTAPKVVLGQYYDQSVDLFSFGVLIYRCLCGEKPFQKKRKKSARREQFKTLPNLDRNVIEMTVVYPEQYFDPNAKSLIKGLLCKNSTNRIGCNNINEIKQHPWFDSIDFGLLETGHLDAPFVPNLQEVPIYADVDCPPRKIKEFIRQRIPEETLNYFEKFNYSSKKAIQDEIMEVFKKVDINYIQENKQDEHLIFDNLLEERRNCGSTSCLCIIS